MSEEAKIENRTLLRTALGVSKLEERKKDKLVPKEVLKAKLNKLKKEGGYRERAVKEMLKDGILIYDSKAGSPDLKLNGRATDNKGNKIVCRHLSYAVLERQLKGYSRDFSTVEGIKKQPSLNENKYDKEKISFHSAYYNLFQLDKLGITLQSIAQVLENGEECNFFLNSENHSMAVSIRHKQDGTYVVKFYDPNATNKHRRALCANLDAVAKLSIKHFLKNKDLEENFPKFKSAVIFSKVQQDSSIPPVLIIDEAVEAQDRVYNFLFYGWEGNKNNNLAKNMTSIFDNDKRSEKKNFYSSFKFMIDNVRKPDTQKEKLKAKSADGCPGLYAGLQNGHAGSVRTYVRMIVGSNQLSIEEKMELLLAKWDDFSGFSKALKEEKTEAIKAYVEEILKSDLSEDHKKELLMCKKENYYLGLFMAMDDGCESSVKAYVQAILENPSLAPARKKEFLDFDISTPAFRGRSLSATLPFSKRKDNKAQGIYREKVLPELVRLEQSEQQVEKIEIKSEFFKQPASELDSAKPTAGSVLTVQAVQTTQVSSSSEQGSEFQLSHSS